MNSFCFSLSQQQTAWSPKLGSMLRGPPYIVRGHLLAAHSMQHPASDDVDNFEDDRDDDIDDVDDVGG